MVGFISVMHKRGDVSFDNNSKICFSRGSVWIEQEIAIAAFLVHAKEKEIKLFSFIEDGIEREGIRQNILLNPKVFDEDDEIINHLRLALPEWNDSINVVTGNALVELSYEKVNITQSEHIYNLVMKVRNTGSRAIKEWHIELSVPKDVLMVENYAREIKNGKTKTHRLFGLNYKEYEGETTFYEGDEKDVIRVRYHINDDIYSRDQIIFPKEVVAKFYVDDDGFEERKTEKKPIQELQNF